MSANIRSALAAELRRIPAFLPRWIPAPGDECLVAEATVPSRLVGLAVLGKPREHAGNLTAALDASVLPRLRESRVLEQLVSPLLQRAAELGCAAVSLLSPQRAGAPEHARFHALGFAPHQTLISYEFFVPAFAQRTRLTYEALVRRNTIPPGAKVVALTPRHWPAAHRLAQSERLTDAGIDERAGRQGLDTYFSPITRVLLLDGKVVGVLLAHGAGHRAEAAVLAVAPNLRGGISWANALLTYHGGLIASALGYETFLMQADPTRHPMTTFLARRMRAPVVREEILMEKRLTKITSP